MKNNLLLAIALIGFLTLGATTVNKIQFYTDYPNSIPVGSDFLLFQRNNDYVNSSVSQMKQDWFNNPVFSGNGGIQGIWTAVTFVGDGSQLTGIKSTATNGPFVFNINGFGTNESFYGPTTFLGTNSYGKLELFDANNIYVAGFDTNKGGWWGFGNLVNFTNFQPSIITVTADTVDPNSRRILAGANITLTDGGAGSTLTIATSGTNFVQTTTNNTFVNTNIMILTSNSTFTVKRGATVVFETNAFLIDSNITASSAVVTDPLQNLTNAANAHGVFTNTVSGPPVFGLLQATELANVTGSGLVIVLSGSPTETNATIKGDQFGTNAFFIDKTGVTMSNNINQVVISNGTIYATGPLTATGQTNTSLTANTLDVRDGNKAETSLANGGAYTFLQGKTPPSYTTLAYSTNIVGAANFVFGKAYWTNITGNFTFPPLTEDAAAYETLVVMVTNSGASVFTATINGVAGAPGHVVPAVFNCTNATVTEIDLSHFGIQWTNACVGKN